MATYWEIAAHSAYDMFSWYEYLIVILFFSHLGFWSGNIFLIAPFPDLCLLVPFSLSGASEVILNYLFHFSTKILIANRIAPDGTPHSVDSHQGLNCLPISHKRKPTFLINVFTALKGSQFKFYLLLLQLVLCRVAALKSLPVHHP